MKHVKKQENIIHNEKNIQKVEIAPELPQMLELARKDVKTVITVFHVFNVFNKDIEKDLNQNFRGENYNV